jgi:type I restriction enzyme S subunit
MTVWREAELGDVCELYQPKTISSANLVDGGEYPVYGANGVIGRFDKFNHAEPQLLVTCRGATCGAVNVSQPNSWINGNAMVVKPRDASIELNYLVHMFKGGVDLSAVITGAAQPQITRQSLAPLKIHFPDRIEQLRIAAILDQADALRAKRREALVQLDSLTQSIFIEMFGDFGSEVCRWNSVKFDEVVKDSRIGLVRGSHELGTENPYPYLRMNAISRDGSLRLEGASLAKATPEEVALYRLHRGDFLFNTRNSRELVGKTALFNSDDLFLYNNNLLRIRFVEGVDSAYVFAAFKTRFIQNELEIRKSGTTNVFAIYYKDLRTLSLPLPPIELQITFATRIQFVEALKATHQAALQELDRLFASLQHSAFRGEL